METDLKGMSPGEIRRYIKENFRDCLKDKESFLECLKKDRRKTVNILQDYLLSEEEKFLTKLQHGRSMMDFDRSYGRIVAGVDEVGRGPLAGPIVGACVVFDTSMEMDILEDILLTIDDSKKLTREKREYLVPLIKEKALAWSIGIHSNDDIDELGLTHCNNGIFLQALSDISARNIVPEIVLSDGYYVRECPYRNERVIKGDARSIAIACASVIAKEYRDSLMREYHNEFPQFSFDTNVGYGSREHMEAIRIHGMTRIHRKSFLRGLLEDGQETESYTQPESELEED